MVNAFQRRTWCPHCAGMPFQNKYSIYDTCKFAKSRGGQCLSDNYINCNVSLKWKCIKRHEWTANFHNIKNGTYCSKYKREELCREIVSKYLGSPSENRWPDFLKTPEHTMTMALQLRCKGSNMKVSRILP
ncbi:hypothetical protein Glove_116g38 [Diversispora epigaea]|uniref:Uncharacterized protein n=1 Tax=Diversispora epigaea TaxID=1348612 RepID=A0A397J9Q3_9GLOM|nr:hypothetical protein Glove_116g38 [Diversispora epigaea]